MAGNASRRRIHLALLLLAQLFQLPENLVCRIGSPLFASHQAPRKSFSRHAWYTNSLGGRFKAANCFSTLSGISGPPFCFRFSKRFARTASFQRLAAARPGDRRNVFAIYFFHQATG